MKRLLPAVLLLIVTLSSSALHANEAGAVRSQEIGRFQLFQGEYTTYDLKRQQTSTTTAVFMIDTATGSVKRYVNRIDEDGRYTETWVPTDLAPMERKKQ